MFLVIGGFMSHVENSSSWGDWGWRKIRSLSSVINSGAARGARAVRVVALSALWQCNIGQDRGTEKADLAKRLAMESEESAQERSNRDRFV